MDQLNWPQHSTVKIIYALFGNVLNMFCTTKMWQCWCPCWLSVNPNTVVSHLNGLTRPSVGLDLPRRTHDCHHQLQYHQHLLNHIPTPRILDSSSSPSGWSGSFTKIIFVPDFPVCKRLLIQEERGEIWNNRAGESARMGSFFLGLGVHGSGTLGPKGYGI